MADKYADATERNARNASGAPRRSRTALTVGAHSASDGTSVTAANSAARTALSRRRSQRSALGNVTAASTSAGRSFATARSRLGASSATSTTCSNSANVPLSLDDRKSGKRLIVSRALGHQYRATRTPIGLTRP
jgi:hypothetical protein